MTDDKITEFNSEYEDAGVIEKLKKKMKLKASVMILIIALLALGTGTLAWFTLNSFSAVDSLEMTIGTGAELRVSTENHGTDLELYTKEITNEMKIKIT